MVELKSNRQLTPAYVNFLFVEFSHNILISEEIYNNKNRILVIGFKLMLSDRESKFVAEILWLNV